MTLRDLLLVAVGAVALLGVAAAVASANAGTGVALAAVVALVAAVSLRRPTLLGSAMASASLVAFLTPWNGWLLGGSLRPGDAFIFLGVACFFAADARGRLPRLPWWSLVLGAAIVLVTALHEVFPTDQAYLQSRLVVDAAGNPIPEIYSNLGTGLKFVVPVVGIPLLFGFAALHDGRAPRRLAAFFAAGASISGLVGFSDSYLGTSFSTLLVRSGDFGGDGGIRSPGFANHPNFLAATCVLSLGFVLWMVVQPSARARRAGWIVLPGILLGIYGSGSRGGAVCAVLMIGLCLVLIPQYRRRLGEIALGLGIATILFGLLVPSVGTALLKAVRLTSNANATGSDIIRSRVREQGIKDFVHSPLDGVGLQVAAEAHNVWLQALASGGVLLFGGLLVFTLGQLITAGRFWRSDPLMAPIIATVITGAVFAALENTLTDRFVYVPAGVLAACLSGAVARADAAAEADTAPAAGFGGDASAPRLQPARAA
ncbi:MAG: O-antigen ligase family protein, partial [Jatrophihabitans sp.]|uniref:O-antigen ligase family protein n=1 Tax=Jatrophihabitans sp. TaxID=1932789 RepID=UPI003F80FB99